RPVQVPPALDQCAVDPLGRGGGPPEKWRGDDPHPDPRQEPPGLGRGTDRPPLCAEESGLCRPGCTRMEAGEGRDLSLLARHAIGADPRHRRRATAHPSHQRATRGGPGRIPQVSPCPGGRGVSKSLVTRFKSELRTTTDLMELVDVLKRVPFSQFPGIGEHIVSQRVEALRDHIVAQFLHRKVARVLVVYPRPLSFTQQEVCSEQLLPYERPPRGSGVGPPEPTETILEPSAY